MSAIPLAAELAGIGEEQHEHASLREAVRAVVPIMLATRAVLLAVSLAVAAIHGMSPWAVWDRWDTIWFNGIAQHGYHWVNSGVYATRFSGSSLAFFPAMPGIIHVGVGFGIPAVVAGLVVANLAFFGALIYLFLLLAPTWGARVAARGLLLLAVFPTAFFFAAPYTESLFLLAAGGTLYHAQRRQALAAGLWLGFAAVTRSTALVLVVPPLMMLRPREIRDWAALLGPAAAGWAVYLLYLNAHGVSLGALAGAQHAWHRGLAFPTTGFIGSVTWLAHNAIAHWPLAIESFGELIGTTVFLLLTARAWPELAPPMRAYCAGFWLLVLCTPEWQNSYAAPFSSMDRFILVLFPLFAWIGMKVPERRMLQIAIVSGAVMSVLAGIHVSGGWVG